jgi:CHAD domain-containing protein
MRFSDFVAYHALQENNRCLHLLSVYPAPLSDNAVHSLRVGIKRLRASWRLLKREVPGAMFAAADARLRTIHQVLGVPRDELMIVLAARSLAGEATKKKTHAAVMRVVTALQQSAGAERVTPDAMDQASAGFQQESGVWRDLDVDRLSDAGLLAGYVTSYRHGRRLGRRAREHDDSALLHCWRRWVKYTYYQLDMIRPVLCSENRARRWYLDRLGDTLGKYHDLVLLHQRLDGIDLDEDERLRVDEALETRLTIFRDRARKLYPYTYAAKGREFGATVAADVARLTFDNVVVLPRSA